VADSGLDHDMQRESFMKRITLTLVGSLIMMLGLLISIDPQRGLEDGGPMSSQFASGFN